MPLRIRPLRSLDPGLAMATSTAIGILSTADRWHGQTGVTPRCMINPDLRTGAMLTGGLTAIHYETATQVLIELLPDGLFHHHPA